VLEVFKANNDRLRELLFAIVPELPLSPDRPALSALEGARF
jgi:5'-methylthioadenosine phosphorylase